MRNASLGFLRDEVEDCCASGFGAGACGSGDGDEGVQLVRYWEAFSERCVDEVEEVIL